MRVANKVQYACRARSWTFSCPETYLAANVVVVDPRATFFLFGCQHSTDHLRRSVKRIDANFGCGSVRRRVRRLTIVHRETATTMLLLAADNYRVLRMFRYIYHGVIGTNGTSRTQIGVRNRRRPVFDDGITRVVGQGRRIIVYLKKTFKESPQCCRLQVGPRSDFPRYKRALFIK